MIIWTCRSCHAEIKTEKEPERCPLCGQHHRGFDQGTRDDPNEEDQHYTQIYEEVIKVLEQETEGCEPEKQSYNFCYR